MLLKRYDYLNVSHNYLLQYRLERRVYLKFSLYVPLEMLY